MISHLSFRQRAAIGIACALLVVTVGGRFSGVFGGWSSAQIPSSLSATAGQVSLSNTMPSSGTDFSVTGWLPGDIVTRYMRVSNSGNVAMTNIAMYLTTSGVNGLDNHITIRVDYCPAGSLTWNSPYTADPVCASNAWTSIASDAVVGQASTTSPSAVAGTGLGAAGACTSATAAAGCTGAIASNVNAQSKEVWFLSNVAPLAVGSAIALRVIFYICDGTTAPTNSGCTVSMAPVQGTNYNGTITVNLDSSQRAATTSSS